MAGELRIPVSEASRCSRSLSASMKQPPHWDGDGQVRQRDKWNEYGTAPIDIRGLPGDCADHGEHEYSGTKAHSAKDGSGQPIAECRRGQGPEEHQSVEDRNIVGSKVTISGERKDEETKPYGPSGVQNHAADG